MENEKIISIYDNFNFDKNDLQNPRFRELLKKNYQKLFNYACSRGDFMVVRFIFIEFPQLDASEGFLQAASNNHLKVAKWLVGPYANVRSCPDNLLVEMVQTHGIRNKKYREMILFLYLNFFNCKKQFDEVFGPNYINGY